MTRCRSHDGHGEEEVVGARQKLNSGFITGSLVLAVLVGLATGSWAAFLATAAVLLALSLYSGDIRPGRLGW